MRLLPCDSTEPLSPVPLNTTVELDRRIVPLFCTPVPLPLIVLPSTCTSAPGSASTPAFVLPLNVEPTIEVFAPLPLAAPNSDLWTRTRSIRTSTLDPPGLSETPLAPVLLIVVLVTKSLPPTVRSSEMPRLVYP